MAHHDPHKDLEGAPTYKELTVSCAGFENNALIPSKYTCDGININPPLNFDHVPEEAQSLALIVDDPDAPAGTWVHWILWNIPVTHHLKEDNRMGISGITDFGKTNYGGPCPPNGTHRYFFKVYALDCKLELPKSSKKTDLEKAMSGHVIGFGELIGLYARK